jgi:hypothetical protein
MQVLPHRLRGDLRGGADRPAAQPDRSPRSPATFVDLRLEGGELLVAGRLRLQALHTPGGKTVAQMLAEASAIVPFMALAELNASLESGTNSLIVLDVREREAFETGRIPGAELLPRGQLELHVNEELTDPTRRILVYCRWPGTRRIVGLDYV